MNKSPFAFHYILFVFAILFIACEEEQKIDKKLIRPVLAQEVTYVGGASTRTFSGTAQTDKVINLSFRGQGVLTKFNVDLGQKVRKGQLLGTLDNVSPKLAYEQSLAQLSSAESSVKTAKLSYDRVRKLYEKGSTSLSDFENAKNAYQTALNSYEATKRTVEIQKEQIRYGYLYAPASGVISQVMAEINENVSPGSPVAVLNVGGEMTIALGLPENVINEVKEEMEVDIHFSALKDQPFKGKITEIAPAIDINTSTYPIHIKIIKPTEEIKTGMVAEITFNFDAKEVKHLVVPTKAVGEDEKGAFVFVLDAESGGKGIAKKQHIKVGKLSANGFEVLEGLSAGQKIITAGLQTLLDGQEVRL